MHADPGTSPVCPVRFVTGKGVEPGNLVRPTIVLYSTSCMFVETGILFIFEGFAMEVVYTQPQPPTTLASSVARLPRWPGGLGAAPPVALAADPW
mgnify:CR=1 FL=1